MVPAFTGLGAPHWDMYARGCLIGLTRGTTREHIIRAAQESIAYQVNDLLTAMKRDTGTALSSLSVDGGASRDSFLMQFQSDISDCTIRRPVIRETTALGAVRSCRTRDRCVAQPRGAEAALAVRYAVCALDGRD